VVELVPTASGWSGVAAPLDPHRPPDVLPRTSVPRARLLDRLEAAAEGRLTLLVAPPGSGATTLVAQWAAGRPDRRVRWLTATPGHDAARLAAELHAALAPGVPTRAAPPGRASARHDPRGVLLAVADALADLPPTTLVLDDVHALPGPAVLDGLADLVGRAPATLHVVATSHVELPSSWRRQRCGTEVVELRRGDLAFTRAEAAQLLGRLTGHRLTAAHVDRLVERTEGWVAGLLLAARVVLAGPDVDRAVAGFGGAHPLVAAHLAELVLDRAPDETRRFLVATSVLDRLSGPLCDHVTCGRGAQALLAELDRTSRLVVREDDRRTWFRVHPLLRDLLRARLRTADPEVERRLLERAAAWHRGRGDVEQAAAYLAAAEAPGAAVAPVATPRPVPVVRPAPAGVGAGARTGHLARVTTP
jgi:LuxR family transcriptional regulator, maltose regulon positive regulatory protein